MYFYAARQPILDRNKQLYAYELLFRDSIDNVFPEIDADEATSKIVEASAFSLSISDFTSSKPAFINFTLDTMAAGYPTMLTNEEVVIEILETVKPGKKLLSLCQDLHQKGYTLALDDYIHQAVWAHFYPYIKIIKIDVLETSVEQIKEIQQAIAKFPHIELLAEKVETHEAFQQAFELGFDYFQGYFFSKPEVVKAKNLSPSQVALAELLYETSKPELDLGAITAVFERDVSLSYKLLRYANSPYFRRRAEIATIKQALVTLGLVELKKLIGLIFAASINPNKPTELINMSMVRAKFCELIAPQLRGQLDVSLAFLTGLLSLIDAILDEDLESILDRLPLAQEIKDALLTRKGPMAALIKQLEFIEKADWQKASLIMEKLGLDKEKTVVAYNQALAFADDQAEQLS